MIARKLSRIARRGLVPSALVWVWLLALSASADDELQASEPATIIENPFAADAGSATTAENSISERRGDVVYQNPFAAFSNAPPIETPLLPGPVSRWRRSVVPLDELLPVKSAILSVDPIESALTPWDELPPAESLRARAAARHATSDAAIKARIADASDSEPLLAEPLSQPEWVLIAPSVIQSLPPIDRVSFDEPILSTDTQPSASDAMQPTSPDANLLPLTISNYVDSPEGWLARAQEAARTAQSIDDLSAIVDMCQHGLRSEPPAEIAASLRRLAAWAHNRRGELLADDLGSDAALADFQAAIALDPGCSLAIHNRGVTLAQQDQLEAALRDFNRVIELNPGLGIAYRNRAELLAALGRFGEAVADYSRAIASLPNDAALFAASGHAWQRLGDFDRAKADVDHALRLAPDNAEIITQRGNLAAEQGEAGDAIASFRQAVAIDPNSVEAYRSLAWLHATCANEPYRDTEQALAAAQKAASLAPRNDHLVLDALAAAHASGGRFAEAIQIQQNAIAAAPAHLAEPLRQRLALYQQGRLFIVGRPEQAAPSGSHNPPSSQRSSRQRSR